MKRGGGGEGKSFVLKGNNVPGVRMHGLDYENWGQFASSAFMHSVGTSLLEHDHLCARGSDALTTRNEWILEQRPCETIPGFHR